MQCPKCGSPLPEGATFCGICGASAFEQQPATQQPAYQNGYQQPAYQGGYQQPTYSSDNTAPLSVGNYVLMFFIMAIPLVNLIMLFVWGFGDGNMNRKNFARAALIIMAISIVLSILLSTIIGSVMMNMMGSPEFY